MIEPLVRRIARTAGFEIPISLPAPDLRPSHAQLRFDKPDLRLPPFYAVEDLFPGAALTGPGHAAGRHRHSEGGRRQPQRTRRAQAVRRRARPARLRRREAPRSRLRRSDGRRSRPRQGRARRPAVHDLFKAMAISSANDAAVALAEYLGGTEERFVKMMNDKAKELGLKNTHFENCNGLPASGHYSSAYDIAVMSRELLSYPKVTNYTGLYEDYLRKNSKKPFWLVNTNKLVRFYPGMDGLKTGYTSEAKYCLTATAKRNNLRFIAVVMGEPDVKKRNQEVSSMMDHAFNHYTSQRIYNKGDLIAEKRIDKGNPDKIRIEAKQPIDMLIKKGESIRDYQKKWVWEDLKAPVKKETVLENCRSLRTDKLLPSGI